MKARVPKGAGNNAQNMNQMIRQAQKMQDEITNLQDDIEARDFTVTAGGGAVELVMTGKKTIKSLTLKPEIVDPNDVEMLQDLIISAVGDSDPLRTPRMKGHVATVRYLQGVDRAFTDGIRRQMLHTTPDDVMDFACELERVCSAAGSCVIGSRELIRKCGDRLDRITELV